jgi:Sodium / potassium ATPase beta chain
MADKNKMHEYYSRPVEMGKWDGFKQFLWNGETSECLGRTGGSWGKCQIPTFSATFFREVLTRVDYVTRGEGKNMEDSCST